MTACRRASYTGRKETMTANALAHKIIEFMDRYDPWTLYDAYGDHLEAIADTARMILTSPRDLVDWLAEILEDLDGEDQQNVAALIIALQSVAY